MSRCLPFPLLEYALPAIPLSSPQLAALESVQRHFSLRVCKRLGSSSLDYQSRLELLGLETMTARRDHSDLAFAHSVFHYRHVCPPLVKCAPNTRYPSAQHLRFSTERKPSRLRSRLAPYRIARKWNSLPAPIRSLKPAAFKRRLVSRTDELS